MVHHSILFNSIQVSCIISWCRRRNQGEIEEGDLGPNCSYSGFVSGHFGLSYLLGFVALAKGFPTT
jgi:hypothetical protein